MEDPNLNQKVISLTKELTKLKLKSEIGAATSKQLSQQKLKLETISKKLSRYLSPQIHKQIFNN